VGDPVIHEQNGTVITRYEGSQNYGNNMDCTWVIDAGPSTTARIQLQVLNSDLQWAPNDSTCATYDQVEILNCMSHIKELGIDKIT